jgi:hypothetical protein
VFDNTASGAATANALDLLHAAGDQHAAKGDILAPW